jgi:hypothetical protein
MRAACALFGLILWAADARGQNITAATATEVQTLLRVAAPPAYSMQVWSFRQDAPPRYRRNPAVWTGGAIDLTGKAVWNSRSGGFGTTAISPLHVVYANHAGGLYPAGTVVRFVGSDDRVVERSVVASVPIGDTDIDLSTLDRPLPPTVHWYKVMPERWFLKAARGLPGMIGGLPCIVLDDNTQSVAVKDLAGFTGKTFMTATPLDLLRKRFTRELYSGDSGSPMFILVGRELVLDGIFHWPAGGPEVSSNLAALDAAMSGSGYRTTVCDLQAFVNSFMLESTALHL